MRAMMAVGRVVVQFGRYPVEALASLCHSVRGDELDDRCAAQRACAPAAAAGVSAPWHGAPRQPWWRETGLRVWGCGAPCARRRHACGVLGIFYSCVRPKPVVPWAPEAARRAFSAMAAAVRAHRIRAAVRAADSRRHPGRC